MSRITFETRLAKVEAKSPPTHPVFRVVDDEAECERLQAQHPDCLIIYRVVIDPPKDSGDVPN